MESERDYIAKYRDSNNAIVIGAWDGETLVGAATGTPMEDHAAEFAAPFEDAGYALGKMFYCAESVLLQPYRGQGAGHAFFDHREAHARALGRRWSCFFAHRNSSPLGIAPMMYFGVSAAMHRCPASTQNSSGKTSATRLKQRNLCSS